MLLLDQQRDLKLRLKELEEQYETAKLEADRANQVDLYWFWGRRRRFQILEEFRTQHKAAAASELENERSLLDVSLFSLYVSGAIY